MVSGGVARVSGASGAAVRVAESKDWAKEKETK
jgi:hypothetical protein